MLFARRNRYSDIARIDRSLGEIESMGDDEREQLLIALREGCLELTERCGVGITPAQQAIAAVGQTSMPFPVEIDGWRNIPRDGCLLVCNHSNTHDIPLASLALLKCGLPATTMVATKGTSPIDLLAFKAARHILIDRTDTHSRRRGLYELAGKLAHGDTCVIFGEGTWNLHPFKPMQNLRIGAVMAAAISGMPVVPTIFEYIEIPEVCSTYSDLFSGCIVRFGKPITIDCHRGLVDQSNGIQTVMEAMRRIIWTRLGTHRTRASDVNPAIYVNHTWLKKFGVPGFTYDSESESRILYTKPGEMVENEWHINEGGVFCPGITPKGPTARPWWRRSSSFG